MKELKGKLESQQKQDRKEQIDKLKEKHEEKMNEFRGVLAENIKNEKEKNR